MLKKSQTSIRTKLKYMLQDSIDFKNHVETKSINLSLYM